MEKIMVVDDDVALLEGLKTGLGQEGFDVILAKNGTIALDTALQKSPAVVILDVNLPDMSGFEICRRLRACGQDMVIIMLSARADEVDRVVGLEVGADDYVTKPFSLRELTARVRANLRRSPAVGSEKLTQYRFEDVEVDFERLYVTRDGNPVDLTSKEFEILRLLVSFRGKVVTRDRLLDEVWGFESYPVTRTVDNHVFKLRHKLEKDPAHPAHIFTVYGEGYKFID